MPVVDSTNSVGTTIDHVRPLLVSAQQAARLLAIGRTTLYELIKRHNVTPIHIGRCVRFSVVELSDLVDRLSSAGVTPEPFVAAEPTATPRPPKRRAATSTQSTLF
jgi:excisionase family DNA binding protein